MPLEFSNVQIDYAALDTHTDPTALAPGALTKAENLTSQVDGRYSKRFGYTDIPGVPPGDGSARAVRLAKRNDELLLVCQSAMTRYQSVGTAWQANLDVPEVRTSQVAVALDQAYDYKKSARATVAGVTIHAWINNSTGDVHITVLSAADNSVIPAKTVTDSAADYEILHVVPLGSTHIAVFYSSVAGQLIRYNTFNCSTLAFGGATTLFSGANVFAGTIPYPYAPFDVWAVSSTDVWMVYATDTPEIRIVRINPITGATVVASTLVAAEEPDGGMAIIATTGEFGVVIYHATTGAVRRAVFNVATGAITAAAANLTSVTGNFNCGLARISSTSVVWVIDVRGTPPLKGYTRTGTISDSGAATADLDTYNVYPHSKPFVYNSKRYVMVYAPYDTQQTYFLMQIRGSNTAIPSAMHAYRTAYVDTPPVAMLTDVDITATGIYAINGPIAYKFLSNSSPRAGVMSFINDFTDMTRFLNVELGATTLFASGCAFRYDGQAVTQNNFLLYPEITAAAGAAGAGMDNGTRSYIAIFESADRNGNVDRSTTSLPVSVTVANGAGNNRVTLTLDHLSVSRNGQVGEQGVIASIFRTENGGTTYYFIGSQIIDRTQANFTYLDTAQDSTILSNRILYTQGGVLDREPAAPCKQLILHQNRVWGISSAEPKMLFYSGDYVAGESPWFSSLQQFRIDDGGEIVALASLDDKLIVFKADRVFAVTGRGGNATGTQSDLSPPRSVSSDCGCIDPRSVLVTPQGVMFQSSKGIYLLTRGEEVSFIGSPVDAYLEDFPVVTSAVMMPTVFEARFDVATADYSSGYKLVYNYRDNRWTTHTNHDLGAAGTTARVDQIVIDTTYWCVDTNANAFRENATFRDPGNTYIVSELETGWIMPAGKQGLVRCQRMMFLNELMEAHGLEVEIDKDYVNVAVQTASFTSADIAALPQEQCSLHLVNQQGESYRFRMSDSAADASNSEGFRAKGLLLTMAAKRGSFEKNMQASSKA